MSRCCGSIAPAIALATALTVGIAIAACGSGDTPPRHDTLLPVPLPALGEVDADVRLLVEQADAAVEDSRSAGDSGEALGEAYGHLGQVLYANRFGIQAEPALLNAAALQPKEPRWPYTLGLLRQRSGRPEAAIADFERTLDLAEGDAPARIRIAQAMLAMGDLDAAGSALEDLQADLPKEPAVLDLLGDLAAHRGEDEAAAAAYEAALGMQPAADALHYKLSMAYRNLGDGERSALHLEQRGNRGVSFADPRSEELARLRRGARAYLAIGNELLAGGHAAEAVTQFQKAVEADASFIAGYLALAGAQIQLGRGGDARRSLEAAAAIEPGHARVSYLQGIVALREDDMATAERHLATSIEADPANVDARFALGNLLRGQDRCAEALVLYDEAAAREPLRPSLTPAYAICLADQGRFEDGLAVLEAAHEAAPADPIVVEALLRMLSTAPEPEPGTVARVLALSEWLEAGSSGRIMGDTPASIFAAEARAMAAAAAGDWATARELQREVIALAEAGGMAAALVAHMGSNLRRFEAEQRAAGPWASPAAYR